MNNNTDKQRDIKKSFIRKALLGGGLINAGALGLGASLIASQHKNLSKQQRAISALLYGLGGLGAIALGHNQLNKMLAESSSNAKAENITSKDLAKAQDFYTGIGGVGAALGLLNDSGLRRMGFPKNIRGVSGLVYGIPAISGLVTAYKIKKQRDALEHKK